VRFLSQSSAKMTEPRACGPAVVACPTIHDVSPLWLPFLEFRDLSRCRCACRRISHDVHMHCITLKALNLPVGSCCSREAMLEWCKASACCVLFPELDAQFPFGGHVREVVSSSTRIGIELRRVMREICRRTCETLW
jgi:hypothetical protein